MPEKVLVNLATGLEDAERVTVAFLVAGAALDRGQQVAILVHQRGGPASRCPATPRASPARAARRSRSCSTSSRRAAASY